MSPDDFLRAFAGGGGTTEPASAAARPLPEAQVMTLREIFADFEARCPFRPGDLVTPAPHSVYQGAGQPFIVLEVFSPSAVLAIADAALSGGRPEVARTRIDMRVAHLDGDGDVCTHCVESWQFKRWFLPEIAGRRALTAGELNAAAPEGSA